MSAVVGHTELLEILMRCRIGGLRLKSSDCLSVFYDNEGLHMLFRFEDGLVYGIEIRAVAAPVAEVDEGAKEIKTQGGNSETDKAKEIK